MRPWSSWARAGQRSFLSLAIRRGGLLKRGEGGTTERWDEMQVARGLSSSTPAQACPDPLKPTDNFTQELCPASSIITKATYFTSRCNRIEDTALEPLPLPFPLPSSIRLLPSPLRDVVSENIMSKKEKRASHGAHERSNRSKTQANKIKGRCCRCTRAESTTFGPPNSVSSPSSPLKSESPWYQAIPPPPIPPFMIRQTPQRHAMKQKHKTKPSPERASRKPPLDVRHVGPLPP